MNSDKALIFDIKMTSEKKATLPTVSWSSLVSYAYSTLTSRAQFHPGAMSCQRMTLTDCRDAAL